VGLVTIVVLLGYGHRSRAYQDQQPIVDTPARIIAAVATNTPYREEIDKPQPKKKVIHKYSKVATPPKGSNVACSCVTFLRVSGIYMPRTTNGLAKSLPVASAKPSDSGGVVKLNESYAGHVAAYILEGNELVLTEANYIRCKRTSGRRIKVDDPRIMGYI
jgi:hypothetical protein